MERKLHELKEILAEVVDIAAAGAVLSWDEQVNMPPGGRRARAEQKATLTRLAHQRMTSPRVGELLAALEEAQEGEEQWPYDSDEAALIRVTRRQYDRFTRQPPELVQAISETSSEAYNAWLQAREESDFRPFQEPLARLVELQKETAEVLGYEDDPYDALLDMYEPGMKTAQVVEVFGELREYLVDFMGRIGDRLHTVDTSVLSRNYDPDIQWQFTLDVLEALGYDMERGRQDKSVHPFTTSFDGGDVRITTRIYPNNLASGLFASIHEAGHALYEQGIDSALRRSPLQRGTSMGMHESQSRLYENMIGRSRPFWKHFWPRLQALFPRQTAGVDLEEFYRAINAVQPSLIRVEADEVTYPLHIMQRFDLERKMLSGDLAVADLPGAWDELMNSYLGITPGNPVEGVLQDIHWSGAMFGYYPTYALGTLMGVQLLNAAREAMPAMDDDIARGDLSGPGEWLRDNIHRHGAKFTSGELLERVTGRGLEAKPFMEYIEAKYSEIFQL